MDDTLPSKVCRAWITSSSQLRGVEFIPVCTKHLLGGGEGPQKPLSLKSLYLWKKIGVNWWWVEGRLTRESPLRSGLPQGPKRCWCGEALESCSGLWTRRVSPVRSVTVFMTVRGPQVSEMVGPWAPNDMVVPDCCAFGVHVSTQNCCSVRSLVISVTSPPPPRPQ